jgi:hypothetical protein
MHNIFLIKKKCPKSQISLALGAALFWLLCVVAFIIKINVKNAVQATFPYKSSLPQPKSCKKVCVFDIDNTLTAPLCWFIGCKDDCFLLEKSMTTAKTIGALRFCIENGYCISICTKRKRSAKNMIPFLKRLFSIAGFSFPKNYFESEAFQYGFRRKEKALKKIMKFFGIKNRKNIILFDNEKSNIENVRKKGFLAQEACSSTNFGLLSCLGGLQQKQFQEGIQKLTCS